MPVAIVTGASSGIGKGTALLFAERGYNVCITARNEKALAVTKQDAVSRGANADQILIVAGDLGEEATAQRIVQCTVEKYGRIDTLVNCAGVLVGGPLLECPLKEYDRVMSVNVRSMILLTQCVLPQIIKTKGSVVNVSSIAGNCPSPGISYYCMSKAAVDQFTKCLALEMAPKGVRVNAVCPGAIVTEIHKRAGQSEEEKEIWLQKCRLTHALGRPGTVDEVSKAILFLAGSDSSFTTGELLRIDGGRGIMFPSASQIKLPPRQTAAEKSSCDVCKSCVKSNEIRSSA